MTKYILKAFFLTTFPSTQKKCPKIYAVTLVLPLNKHRSALAHVRTVRNTCVSDVAPCYWYSAAALPCLLYVPIERLGHSSRYAIIERSGASSCRSPFCDATNKTNGERERVATNFRPRSRPCAKFAMTTCDRLREIPFHRTGHRSSFLASILSISFALSLLMQSDKEIAEKNNM